MLEQDSKNPELFRRQFKRCAGHGRFVSSHIHRQLVDSKFRLRSSKKLLSSEQCLDDGQPFSVAEGRQHHVISVREFFQHVFFCAKQTMRLERNHGDVPYEGIATQQRDDFLPPVNDGQFTGCPLRE